MTETLTVANVDLRSMPAAPASEAAALGSALISTRAVELLLRSVTQREFVEPRHRAIYAALESLHSKGGSVDALTLQGEMQKRGWLEKAGGPRYIHQVAEAPLTAKHVEAYAKEVSNKALLRDLIELGRALVEAGFAPDADPQDLIDQYGSTLFALGKRIDSWELVSAAVAHAQQQEELDARKEPLLYKTGIADLDQVLYLSPGDLVVLSGQTSIGKSATALNWLSSAALTGTPCLMVTLEMSRRQCENRVLAANADLPLSLVSRRRLDDAQLEQAREINELLKLMPLHYTEKSGGSVEALCGMIRDSRDRHGVEIVVIDQLNRLRPKRPVDERQDLDYCVRTVKDSAMSLGTSTVLIHQLKRTPGVDTPDMDSLRGSNAIAQDSDAVILAHRPGRKKAKAQRREEEDDSLMDWYCDKQRNGPAGWKRQRVFRRSTQSILTLEDAKSRGYRVDGQEEDEEDDDWRTR